MSIPKIIGTEVVDGIRLGHTFHEYSIIQGFLYESKPSWFIEIGIHEGGLTYLLLQNRLLDDIGYMGIELNCNIIKPKVKEIINKRLFSHLICTDCFASNSVLIAQSLSNKIIYCDGGYKARELKVYKHTCRSGDIILAHDFYDGTRTVRDVPIENISIEVTAEDIVHMEEDRTFDRLPEYIFFETRIIGWRKR